MPLNEDDLKFVLKIDPDVKAVNDALAQMGANIDRAAEKAAPGFWRSLTKPLYQGKNVGAEMLLAALAGGPGLAGELGGIAGGAIGGPLGAIVGGKLGGAAAAIPGAIGNLGAMPVRAVAGGLNQIANALNAIQGPLGPIGAGLGALQAGLSGVSSLIKSIPLIGSVLGPFTDALASIPGIIGGITGSLLSMSEKASPGVFYLWTRALEDAQATIGERFVPVVELMRDVVNLFSDSLGKILPNMTEVRGALSEFREMLGEAGAEIRGVLNELGPSIREVFIDALKQLSHWLAVATRAITLMAERLRVFFGTGAAGRAGAGAGEEERMRTFAAKPATFTTAEQFEKTFQQGAFMIGGGRKDPQQEMRDAMIDLVKIDQEAANLLGSIDRGWESIRQVGADALEVGRETLVVLRTIGSGVKAIVDTFVSVRKALTPTDPTADKIARIFDVAPGRGGGIAFGGGEAAKEYGLDRRREMMKRVHPEYFSTGTVH